MRLDLHIHTTASDGAWSPARVVEGAIAGRLDVIAITDHDTAAGVPAAMAAAEGQPIQVLAGIEVSSAWRGRDVHVLGYFVDPSAPVLMRHAERARTRRDDRMREMIERLDGQGVHVSFEDVERAAGPDRVVIGRPHLAKALVEAGYASSVPETFRTLIGDDSDAFVPAHLLDPMEAVGVVRESGGVAMWAHPPGDMVDELLPQLVETGLAGLEVYRPRSRRTELLRLETICRTSGLLTSGGSDWHGPDAGSVLGDFYLNADEVEGLLKRGGL
ncbi:MAG: PHP domain-containing protein [Gemmatimonadota bacterium]